MAPNPRMKIIKLIINAVTLAEAACDAISALLIPITTLPTSSLFEIIGLSSRSTSSSEKKTGLTGQ